MKSGVLELQLTENITINRSYDTLSGDNYYPVSQCPTPTEAIIAEERKTTGH